MAGSRDFSLVVALLVSVFVVLSLVYEAGACNSECARMCGSLCDHYNCHDCCVVENHCTQGGCNCGPSGGKGRKRTPWFREEIQSALITLDGEVTKAQFIDLLHLPTDDFQVMELKHIAVCKNGDSCRSVPEGWAFNEPEKWKASPGSHSLKGKVLIAEDLYQIFARPVNGLQVVSVDKSEVQADGKVMITFEYLLPSRSVGIIVEEFVNKAIAAVQGQDTTNRRDSRQALAPFQVSFVVNTAQDLNTYVAALRTVPGINKIDVKPLEQPALVGSGGGLSDGAVAGIIVGSVVGGLLLVSIIAGVTAVVATKVSQRQGVSTKAGATRYVAVPVEADVAMTPLTKNYN